MEASHCVCSVLGDRQRLPVRLSPPSQGGDDHQAEVILHNDLPFLVSDFFLIQTQSNRFYATVCNGAGVCPIVVSLFINKQ